MAAPAQPPAMPNGRDQAPKPPAAMRKGAVTNLTPMPNTKGTPGRAAVKTGGKPSGFGRRGR